MRKARPATKAGQRDATMGRLLKVARQAFTQSGYADASTEGIVRRAGVTRGALYHHFESKEGLFRSVLAQVHEEVGVEVERAASAAEDGWEALRSGCLAFLRASNGAAVRRIMLVDGPAVLGWNEWRGFDADQSLRLLRAHLTELSAAGVLAPLPTTALAHLLSGAMNELALWIAEQDDEAAANREAAAVLDAVLNGLRRRPA